MAIITYSSSPSKGSTITATLNKAELLAISAVTADPWWADELNITQAIVTLDSNPGSGKIITAFDFSQNPCTASISIPARCRDVLLLEKIVLIDTMGDKLSIKRPALLAEIPTLSESDVDNSIQDTNPPFAMGLSFEFSPPAILGITVNGIGDETSTSLDVFIYRTNTLAYSVEDAEAGTLVASTSGETSSSFLGVDNSYFISGSMPDGEYYYAAVVVDQAGNKSYISDTYIKNSAPQIVSASLSLSENPPIYGITEVLVSVEATDGSMGTLGWYLYEMPSPGTDVADIELRGMTPIGSGSIDSGVPFQGSVTTLYLAEGTYYYSIIVEDESLNKTFSNMSLTINYAPTVSNPAVMILSSTTEGFDIGFNEAADDDTILEYKVVASLNDNINTVADAEANGYSSGDWLAYPFDETGAGIATISGLNHSTTYFVNILVRDPDGAKSIYTATTGMTAVEADPFVSLSLTSGTNAIVSPISGGTAYAVTTNVELPYTPVQAVLQLNQPLSTQLSEASIWSLFDFGDESISNSDDVFILYDQQDSGGNQYQLNATPVIQNLVWDEANLRYTFDIQINRYWNGAPPLDIAYSNSGMLRIRKDRLCGSAGCGLGTIDITFIPQLIDSDNDSLTDVQESNAGTNPNNPDSDGDGYTDFEEVVYFNSNPNDPNDPQF